MKYSDTKILKLLQKIKDKEMVQDFNNTYGRDSRIKYHYEKWEIMHYE